MLGLRPDVAVLDVRLPPTFTDEGLRAALAARQEIPGLPVLIPLSTSNSSTPESSWQTATAALAISSRTGSWTRTSFSTPLTAWPGAAQH